MEIIKGAIICLNPGAKLSDVERQEIARYIEFVRKRNAKKEKKPKS